MQSAALTRFRRNHRPGWPPVHRPRSCGSKGLPCGEPRAVGMQPSSRSRRKHVPQHRTAPLLAGSPEGTNQPHSARGAAPHPSGSAPPRGDRGHGASFLSATLPAGRHRAPAAHCTAHSPAHRSASKCQVRSPDLNSAKLRRRVGLNAAAPTLRSKRRPGHRQGRLAIGCGWPRPRR
jgi:hypothetical protein